MNVLMLGLYAEGRTDERFLPEIIRRTSQRILQSHDRFSTEPMLPFVIERDASLVSLDECILQAARQSFGYHALIVHSDSDDRGYKQTLVERFFPGYQLVQQSQENVCMQLVPIIPVHMVEAWMLADPDAIGEILQSPIRIQSLGLPTKAKLVEMDAYPKDTLRQIVQNAYPHKPRVWNRLKLALYDQLAPLISLERLDQVPSYKQFVGDLTSTLKTLNLIQ